MQTGEQQDRVSAMSNDSSRNKELNLDDEFDKFREKTKPESKLRNFLSRRDFLKLSWLLTGSLLACDIYLLGKLSKSDDFEELVDYQKALLKLSHEQRQSLEDIKSYRKDLGLNYEPYELIKAIIKNAEKTENNAELPPPFDTSEVPKFNFSYAERVREICQTILGNNFSRLIKGISLDINSPYGFFFNSSTRKVQLGSQVNEIPLVPDFNHFTAHEALGHGTDPDIDGHQIYTLDQMLKVELGKWMALSRMFDIKDQFLNHPGDMMKPFLARKVGQEVAFAFFHQQEQQSLNWIGAPILYDKINTIAKNRGCSIEELKFNKAACKEIGLEIIAGIRDRGVKLKNSAKYAYEDGMATVGHEIYAEMVRYSLITPELIGYDQVVLSGIALALRGASDGQFDFNNAIEIFKTAGEEIIQRNEVEQQIISKSNEENTEDEENFVSEESESMEKNELEQEIIGDLAEIETREKTYEDHLKSGTMKDESWLPPEILSLAKTYLSFIQKIVEYYPFMLRAEYAHLDESFDPNMHIWEIQEIETALESSFTSRLIFGEIEDLNWLDEELKRRNRILKNFISSRAFGT